MKSNGRIANLKTLFHTYPREAMLFVLASFVNAAGSAFMWPLTTLYVHNVLHRSMGEAGFVLMLQSLAGIAGQFTGGALFHRLGAKKLIVGSLFLCGITQLSVLFAADFSVYTALMALLGFLNSVTMPSIQAFIGFRWKEKRLELFNIVYVGNNIGMAIGTSLAGILASYSFSLTFLANSISTFGFALFFLQFMKRINPGDTAGLTLKKTHMANDQSALRLMMQYKVYLFMALGSALVWFSTCVWGTGIAAHIDRQGMSVAAYSFLWTVNGIVIFAGQPVTSLLKRTVARSLCARLVASAACYAAGFAFILLLYDDYRALVLGMIIATFGEMLIAPTIPAFITENTGSNAPFYLGVVGAFGSAGRLFGPLLMGHMYDDGGVLPVLLLATATAAAAVLLFLIHASFHRTDTVKLTL
jgi:MFS family permease